MPEKPYQQDSLKLDNLDKLVFSNNQFEYSNKIYDYKDIKHIEFLAAVVKHRVNFVPSGTSYDAKLFLHLEDGSRLHIKQERSLLDRKNKARFEAIMRAAGMFMDITFEQRVTLYERLMEEKGFVVWGKYQIARDGDLFKMNELCFNILKDDISCQLGPFSIECHRRNSGLGEKLKTFLFGSVETIDLSIDKDCFLYVMKQYLDLSWKNQPVPEKRRKAKDIFNEALLTLGARLCKVDGRVSAEEIIRFKEYFGIDESVHPGAGKIFREAINSSEDIRETARKVFDLLGGKKEPLEYILLGLMKIASADGVFDKAEEEFIHVVATMFKFSEEKLNRLLLIFEYARKESAHAEENTSTKTEEYSQRIRHLRVLGLNGNATIQDVKLAYRRLARKHHPDILRARGVPIDDIKDAEEILKVINVAYKWLGRHYRKEAEVTT